MLKQLLQVLYALILGPVMVSLIGFILSREIEKFLFSEDTVAYIAFPISLVLL
jgi:hypothetical protein